MLVEIDGKTLAFGLRWRSLSGDMSPDKEIGELARALGVKSCLYSKKVDPNWAAFLHPDDYQVSAKKIIPAAMALAAAARNRGGSAQANAIFFGEVEHGVWTVLIVKNGHPISTDEFLGTKAEGDAFLREYLQFESEVGYEYYGEGYAEGGGPILSLEDLAATDIVLPLKSAGLPPVAIAAVLLVFLGMIAGGGWYYMDQQAKKKVAAQQQAAPAIPDARAYYEQSLVEKLKPAFAGPRANSNEFADLMKVVQGYPVENAGWRVRRVTCSKNNCSTLWERTSGTFESFVKESPGWLKPMKFYTQPFGNSIDAVSTAGVEPLYPVVAAEMPKFNEFVVDTGSVIQQYDPAMAFSMTDPAVFAMPSEIAGREAEIGDALVKFGTWEMRGPLRLAVDYLAGLPGNMTVDNFELTVSDRDVSMQVKGRYYVH